MAISPIALWMNTCLAGFDLSITQFIHGLYNWGGSFFTPFFSFVSFLGKDGIILIVLSLFLIVYKPTRRYGTAMLIGLALGALLVNCFLKIVIARPRPYADESSVYYQLWQLVGMRTESDKSFPSGHTTAAFDSMIPLWLTCRYSGKKWGWTAWIFAILMGISRIYLCVHYPTDVIGGMIVGIFAGVMGYIIMRHITEKWYELDFIRRPQGKHLAK